METLGLRVPNRSFREFGLFNVDHKRGSLLPLDAIRQQVPSAMLMMRSMDVPSRLTILIF
jgi:hypothetical protein